MRRCRVRAVCVWHGFMHHQVGPASHIAVPARHQAHGHGVAQQATQDQHEDEEDGQGGAHAANLSDATPVAP